MSRSTWVPPLWRRCHFLPLHGLLLGLALCLLLPSGADAETPGDAQTYLLSAQRLYESLDYEGALTQIRLARQVPRSREQELSLLLYEGIILAELSQWVESSIAFKTALALNADARLPVRVSPKVEDRFEFLRNQIKSELAAQAPPAREQAPPMERPSAPAEMPNLHAEQPSAPVEKPSLPAKTTPLPPAPMPRTVTASPSKMKTLQSYSPFPAIAGGTLVVAGGISWALSRGELNRLRTGSSSLMSEEDVQRSVSHGRAWQTLGFSLLGAGSAGLLTAAGLYVFGGPAQPVALGAGTTGSAAFVYGRWP